MSKIKYENLEKHFTKGEGPLYGNVRIPRKLKKRVKQYMGVHWDGFSNVIRLWDYLGFINPNYKSFLIKEICKKFVN